VNYGLLTTKTSSYSSTISIYQLGPNTAPNTASNLFNSCYSNLADREERKSIYTAPFILCIFSKRSDMDHTVLPANYTMPAFPS